MSEPFPETPRILIVDDRPQNLQLLETMLGDQGCQVCTVSSGELALQAVRQAPPQLILLDILMPGLDGYEVCARLKAEPGLRDIPVLFLSGLSAAGDRVRAFQAGGVDFIAKPFQLEEVKARVRNHLELARQRRALQAANEQLQAELAGHRRTQAALRAAEERFRGISEHAHDAICLIEPAGKIVWCNDQAVRLSGHARAQLLAADSFAVFVAPESLATVGAHFRQFQAGAPHVRRLGFDFIRADGQRRTAQTHLAEISDRSGQRLLVVSMLDVTEGLRAEAALREAEALFRTLTESLPLGIYVSAGPEHIAVYVNPAFTRLTGYTLQDLPAMADWWTLAYPQESYRQQTREEWGRRVQRALATRLPIEPLESFVACKDGSQKTFLTGFIPLGAKNCMYGLDLTELKLAESEAQYLRHKQRLVRDLHDGLGGMSANIGMFAARATRETEPAARARLLATLGRLAVESGLEVRALMSTLRAAQRDWGDLVHDLRRYAALVLDPAGFQWELTVTGELPEAGLDSLAALSLARIFREAITNINKHARARWVILKLMFHAEHCQVEIQDDGVGFAPATVPVGQGLRNIRQRVGELGGLLQLQSGPGTRFRSPCRCPCACATPPRFWRSARKLDCRRPPPPQQIPQAWGWRPPQASR
jgi:PAS domain S-box-containing protein